MKRERILLLEDASIETDISADIRDWIAYERETLGINLNVVRMKVRIPELTIKPFRIVQVRKGVEQELYGLDGIKQKIRDRYTIPQYAYAGAFFLYGKDAVDAASDLKLNLAHWSYFEPLMEGTQFSEVFTTQRAPVKDTLRVLTHEMRHQRCYRLRRLGKAVRDVMDCTPPAGQETPCTPYLKEYDVYATDGNRAAQNSILRPYADYLMSFPELKGWLGTVADFLKKLYERLETPTEPEDSGLVKWAEAIKKHEGWFIGSRSYRNLNPGNFRYTNYIRSLGAIGSDDGNYSIFPTYEKGWQALLQFLRDAQANRLYSYREYARAQGHSVPTLRDFFHVYAPSSDSNDPDHYAKTVASYIGVSVDIPINQI